MNRPYEMLIGPTVMLALQRLTNKRWQPTELLPRIRSIKYARIAWQLEDWPYARTVGCQGSACIYTLTLPRRQQCGDAWLPAAPVRLNVEPKSGYREHELLTCIHALLYGR
jgi:hypothetical protein